MKCTTIRKQVSPCLLLLVVTLNYNAESAESYKQRYGGRPNMKGSDVTFHKTDVPSAHTYQPMMVPSSASANFQRPVKRPSWQQRFHRAEVINIDLSPIPRNPNYIFPNRHEYKSQTLRSPKSIFRGHASNYQVNKPIYPNGPLTSKPYEQSGMYASASYQKPSYQPMPYIVKNYMNNNYKQTSNIAYGSNYYQDGIRPVTFQNVAASYMKPSYQYTPPPRPVSTTSTTSTAWKPMIKYQSKVPTPAFAPPADEPKLSMFLPLKDSIGTGGFSNVVTATQVPVLTGGSSNIIPEKIPVNMMVPLPLNMTVIDIWASNPPLVTSTVRSIEAIAVENTTVFAEYAVVNNQTTTQTPPQMAIEGPINSTNPTVQVEAIYNETVTNGSELLGNASEPVADDSNVTSMEGEVTPPNDDVAVPAEDVPSDAIPEDVVATESFLQGLLQDIFNPSESSSAGGEDEEEEEEEEESDSSSSRPSDDENEEGESEDSQIPEEPQTPEDPQTPGDTAPSGTAEDSQTEPSNTVELTTSLETIPPEDSNLEVTTVSALVNSTEPAAEDQPTETDPPSETESPQTTSAAPEDIPEATTQSEATPAEDEAQVTDPPAEDSESAGSESSAGDDESPVEAEAEAPEDTPEKKPAKRPKPQKEESKKPSKEKPEEEKEEEKKPEKEEEEEEEEKKPEKEEEEEEDAPEDAEEGEKPQEDPATGENIEQDVEAQDVPGGQLEEDGLPDANVPGEELVEALNAEEGPAADGEESEVPAEETPGEVATDSEVEDVPVEETADETPAEEALSETPAEEVLNDTPADDVANETPAEDVANETPAEDVANETPAEEVLSETPAEDVANETPAEEVLSETPAEDVANDTPAEEVLSETPAEDVANETPAEEVLSEPPAEEVLNDTPAEDVANETPAEEVLSETPAEDVPIDTNVEDVPIDTNVEDVPSEVIPQDIISDANTGIAEDVPSVGNSEISSNDAGIANDLPASDVQNNFRLSEDVPSGGQSDFSLPELPEINQEFLEAFRPEEERNQETEAEDVSVVESGRANEGTRFFPQDSDIIGSSIEEQISPDNDLSLSQFPGGAVEGNFPPQDAASLPAGGEQQWTGDPNVYLPQNYIDCIRNGRNVSQCYNNESQIEGMFQNLMPKQVPCIPKDYKHGDNFYATENYEHSTKGLPPCDMSKLVDDNGIHLSIQVQQLSTGKTAADSEDHLKTVIEVNTPDDQPQQERTQILSASFSSSGTEGGATAVSPSNEVVPDSQSVSVHLSHLIVEPPSGFQLPQPELSNIRGNATDSVSAKSTGEETLTKTVDPDVNLLFNVEIDSPVPEPEVGPLEGDTPEAELNPLPPDERKEVDKYLSLDLSREKPNVKS